MMSRGDLKIFHCGIQQYVIWCCLGLMFFGNILQFSYQKNDQNGADFAKKILFGCGSSECQQQAQVYQ